MSFKKPNQLLKQILFLSCCVNVVMVILFYMTVFRKDVYKLPVFTGPLIAKSRHIEGFPEDFLEQLSQASLQEICAFLDDDRLLFGYPVSLWALGVAIHHHYVDITPALPGSLTFLQLKNQGRTWFLPKLTTEECVLVRRYLNRVRYPFTSQGLFYFLAKEAQQGKIQADGLYHFCHIPEFIYLRTLLAGAETEVGTIPALVQMVLQGGEELFFSLCNEYNRNHCISDKQRREVLTAYIARKDPLAALLLLVHDSEWVLHEFSDEALLFFLRLVPKDSPYTQRFFIALEQSPRMQAIEKLL